MKKQTIYGSYFIIPAFATDDFRLIFLFPNYFGTSQISTLLPNRTESCSNLRYYYSEILSLSNIRNSPSSRSSSFQVNSFSHISGVITATFSIGSKI